VVAAAFCSRRLISIRYRTLSSVERAIPVAHRSSAFRFVGCALRGALASTTLPGIRRDRRESVKASLTSLSSRSGLPWNTNRETKHEHCCRICKVLRSRDEADMRAAKSLTAHTAPTNARRPSFDGVTICLHWATVLFVLAMFASAWLRSQTEEDISKAVLLQTHRSLGLTIWVATAYRLAWRLSHAKLPPFPANMTKAHRAIVYWSEYGLYAMLLAQPATGLGATLLSGRPFALFLWGFPQLGPQDKVLWATFHLAHELGAWALGALAVGHAAAALFHYFVLCDDVLQCMAPVITTAPRNQEFSPSRVIRETDIKAQ
jgi:superoxide oxidase